MAQRRHIGRRQVVALGIAAFAAVAAVAAPLAGATTWRLRIVRVDYSTAAGFTTPYGNQPPLRLTSGSWVPAGTGENSVRVSTADESGRVVALAVEYTPPRATATTTRVFCGGSGWLPIRLHSQVRAVVLAGQCPDGEASAPTLGTITLTFRRPVDPPRRHHTSARAQRWAVLIGIQNYTPPTERTYGGAGDVTAILKALRHAGWPRSHILVVRDRAATAHRILTAMAWLVRHSGPHTFSLFHYSGHVCIASRGPCPSGHTYLWGADNRFLSETVVGRALRPLRGYAWIDIAGCEAGAFNQHLATRKRLFTGSSQPGRTSYEEPTWHESVWTGLTWDRAFNRGAATGHRYRATINQMVRYGVRNAPRYTQQGEVGPQHPYVRGGHGVWRLWAPPG